jgi:GTP pyrophosphokinase
VDVRAVSNKQENVADLKFVVEISGLESLSKVLNRIQQLPNVIEVKRVQNN